MLVNDLGKIVESGIGGVLLLGQQKKKIKMRMVMLRLIKMELFNKPFIKLKKNIHLSQLSLIYVSVLSQTMVIVELDKNKLVNNDETLVTLSSMAKSMCDAGVDIVAPSSMMDGQVHAIREKLDSNNYENKIIMSYSTKFASSLYDPFRDAENSQPSSGDRKALPGILCKFRFSTKRIRI